MFASKIKKLRKEKGLKINEVASFLAIDSSLVSRFEAGTRRPTDHQVVKLEDFYKTKPNELLREWVADDIINNLKKYSFAGDVMQIVEDAISGYQTLLNKQKKQVLPKNLVKVLHDIDLLKKQIDALKPLNVLQLKKLNDYFFTQYTYDSNKIE
ncbi:MAG: helix-turn-helix domain-containing protein, partial [Bacteroidia bacterium]